MEPKSLKLGWTVSETIGVAIVNPRGLTNMKAIPHINLTYRNTTVTIRKDSVTIDGVMEEAAVALANHIMKDAKRDSSVKYFSYMSIEAYFIDGKVLLNTKVQKVMEADRWALLKKEVEKICNGLKAFL